MNELQKKFMELLSNSPQLLADFVKILDEFYKLQGEASPVKGNGGRPPVISIGGPKPTIKSSGIAQEDLAALAKNAAEAVTKERAVAYAKGFIAGAMFVA